MSYDITFIKNTKSITLGNIYDILEKTDVKKTDPNYISKELSKRIISSLNEKGLTFEISEHRGEFTGEYTDIDFTTFQVSIFDSQISISLPYWRENTTEKVNKEVELIASVLIENGFIGFDSQTEEFITDSTNEFYFKSNFQSSKEIVDNHFLKSKETIVFPIILFGLFLELLFSSWLSLEY